MPTTKSPPSSEEPINIRPLRIHTLEVIVEGVTPLIVNRFDEKAKDDMLARMAPGTRPKREAKDPEKECERRRYRLPDGRDGFPAVAFKAALIGGARHFEGVTMTGLKSAIYIHGEGGEHLVAIDGEFTPRQDAVRNASGVADLRYRPQYWPWSVTLNIDFIASLLTVDSVVALLNAGGFGGVGEWRPSAPKSLTGTYGKFQIKEDQ
jgi:hypothetical protein